MGTAGSTVECAEVPEVLGVHRSTREYGEVRWSMPEYVGAHGIPGVCGVRWSMPEYVAYVEYAEYTKYIGVR